MIITNPIWWVLTLIASAFALIFLRRCLRLSEELREYSWLLVKKNQEFGELKKAIYKTEGELEDLRKRIRKFRPTMLRVDSDAKKVTLGLQYHTRILGDEAEHFDVFVEVDMTKDEIPDLIFALQRARDEVGPIWKRQLLR